METIRSVVIELGPDQVYPAPEEGKVRVELTIRNLASLMATHRTPKGVFGAVMAQLANTNITSRLGQQVAEYLWDTNEHPTLVQGVINICWYILVTIGMKLEAAEVDRRLQAGRRLTTKLVELVDKGELPGGLPCI